MHSNPVVSSFVEAHLSLNLCRDNAISTEAFLSLTKQARSILQYFIDYSNETVEVFDQTIALADSTAQKIKTIQDRSIEVSAAVATVYAICNTLDQTSTITSLAERNHLFLKENAKRAEEHFASMNAINSSASLCSIKVVVAFANQLNSKLQNLQDLLTAKCTRQASELNQALTSLSQIHDGNSPASYTPMTNKKNDDHAPATIQVFLNALWEAERDVSDAQIKYQRQIEKTNLSTQLLAQSTMGLTELSQTRNAFLIAESTLDSLIAGLRQSTLSITDTLERSRDLAMDWNDFTFTNNESKKAILHLDEFIQQRAKSNPLITQQLASDSKVATELMHRSCDQATETLIPLIDLLNHSATLNDRLLVHTTLAATLQTLLTNSFANMLKMTTTKLDEQHNVCIQLSNESNDQLTLICNALNDAQTNQSIALVALQTAQAAINQS